LIYLQRSIVIFETMAMLVLLLIYEWKDLPITLAFFFTAPAYVQAKIYSKFLPDWHKWLIKCWQPNRGKAKNTDALKQAGKDDENAFYRICHISGQGSWLLVRQVSGGCCWRPGRGIEETD
jgi:hypothetical protein